MIGIVFMVTSFVQLAAVVYLFKVALSECKKATQAKHEFEQAKKDAEEAWKKYEKEKASHTMYVRAVPISFDAAAFLADEETND